MPPIKVIRRIDDLGRVVIPKEIRCEMGVKQGDTLSLIYENGCVKVTKVSLIHRCPPMPGNYEVNLEYGTLGYINHVASESEGFNIDFCPYCGKHVSELQEEINEIAVK